MVSGPLDEPEVVGGGELVEGGVLVGGGVELVLPAVTWMEKTGPMAELSPLLTPISMLLYVPTLDEVGLPVSVPVELLKVAHEGFWTMAKESARPFAPVTVGVKV